MKKLSRKYEIKARLSEVFHALTSEDLIEQWSFSEAKMDLKPGGKFSLWGGDIVGVNREVSETRLVQDWKEAPWPEMSRVTFTLSEMNGITTLELVHEGIPEASFKGISEGWDEYYLGPLKDVVEGQEWDEEFEAE